MIEPNIELAKARIWKRLESKLPQRPHSEFASVLFLLRKGTENLSPSGLKKVQAKERLLDLLPEREPVGQTFLSPRLVSFGTLGLLFGTLLTPLMNLTPTVSASSQNTLELVEGTVLVNGIQVTETTMLQVGDTVETTADAMAHLIFVDDSRLTLGPSSKVELVDAWVDASNRSNSRVELIQESGRSWSQILNLTGTGSFEIAFPQGKVLTDQRASFDLQVSEEGSTVEVARNLVNIELNLDSLDYSGVLGQGAALSVDDGFETKEVSKLEQEDVWWTFNLAYGKSYARTLNQSYQQENISRALILPGNPLYALKTFREDLQVSFAFTDGAKQALLIQQAEARLNEAQVLMAQGNSDSAAEVMKVYQETVDAVQETEPSTELIALEDEAQKQALTDHDSTGADFKTNLNAGASLQLVPDLIAEGHYSEAEAILEAYGKDSLSVLTQLEAAPMEDREAIISELLDQKLSDLQILKVIVGMPSISEVVDLNSTVLKELSMMALSLREKELGNVAEYFDLNLEGFSSEEALYDHLKDDFSITDSLAEQFDEVHTEAQTSSDSVIIELHPVEEEELSVPSSEEIIDFRFEDSVSHSDQAEE